MAPQKKDQVKRTKLGRERGRDNKYRFRDVTKMVEEKEKDIMKNLGVGQVGAI